MEQPLVALFLLFGVLGWIIDTGFRSFLNKKYSSGTLLPGFGVIYAVAGIIIVAVFRYLPLGAVSQVLIATVLVTTLELLGGMLSLVVLKRRLWDYRAHKYHFMGHIEIRHAFYWVLIVSYLRMVYHFAPY